MKFIINHLGAILVSLVGISIVIAIVCAIGPSVSGFVGNMANAISGDPDAGGDTPAGAPAAPTVANITTDSITLNIISGCEYRTSGSAWQDSPTFSGLSAGTTYTFYARYKETASAAASVSSSASFTTVKNSAGSPAAPTAQLITSTNIRLNLIEGCEYSIDGTKWQSSPSFYRLSPATTYTLYARYKETSTTYASPASSAQFTTLNASAIPAAPPAPTAYSVTSTTVTLNEIAGCEYSLDCWNWQDSPTFTGLDPNTTYTFFARYKATGSIVASEISCADIKTDKGTPSAPAAPTAQSITSTSITLNAISGCEYSINGTTWQDSTTFSGLTANTTYTFHVRYKETAETYASPASSAQIKTDKTSAATPAAPTAQSITTTSITLNAISGCEYSIDGNTWQDSTTFSGLSIGTKYTFYARYKATNTSYASQASFAQFTTSKLPYSITVNVVKNVPTNDRTAFVINGTTYTYEELKSGFEAGTFTVDQLSSITWGACPPSGGGCGAAQPFVYNGASYKNCQICNHSLGMTFTTETWTYQPSAPAAPTAQSITSTSITLNAISGCEYSIDGSTWQDSNVFSGLNAGTTYTLYARYKETSTCYASGSSSAQFKTDKGTPSAPAAPTAQSITSTSITLNAISGCEYSINGTTWQDSTTFSSLTANTTYTLYARYKETSEAYASPASSAQFTTSKPIPAAPAAPTAQSITSTSITLNAISGCEYSIDGNTWQDSNVFSGLNAGTTYTLYIRYAETSTNYASPASSAEFSTYIVVTLTGSGNTSYSYVTINGNKYTSASTLEVPLGTEITCIVGTTRSASGRSATITRDDEVVAQGNTVNYKKVTYSFEADSSVTISLTYSSTVGKITITSAS